MGTEVEKTEKKEPSNVFLLVRKRFEEVQRQEVKTEFEKRKIARIKIALILTAIKAVAPDGILKIEKKNGKAGIEFLRMLTGMAYLTDPSFASLVENAISQKQVEQKTDLMAISFRDLRNRLEKHASAEN